MKKIISILLICLVLTSCFALCACNESEKEYIEDGATVVTFYAREFEDWSNKYLKKLVNEFNSNLNDGIQVKLKFYGEDTYIEALKVARENGKAPDIYMSTYADIYSLIVGRHIAPLNNYLSEEAVDDMMEATKEMVTYNGNIYAYPWNVEPATLLFYRKDLLQEAKVNKVPATWDELYDALAALKKQRNLGEYCLGLPLGSGELGWVTYGMQQNTTGGLALDDSWTKSRLDQSGFKDLAEFFYKIYVNDYSPNAALVNKGYTYIVDALCDGKLAMTFAGSWCIAEIYDYAPSMVDKIGIAPIPTKDGDSSKATSSNGGWSYCMSEESKHKEKAAAFLNWMFTESAERTAQYFIKAHNSKAPTSKSVKEYLDAHSGEVPSEWANVVNDVASKAICEATYSWDIALEVGKIFENMQINCKDMAFPELYAQALQTAQSNIALIMTRANYMTNPKYQPATR